jgi:hypothetical protein
MSSIIATENVLECGGGVAAERSDQQCDHGTISSDMVRNRWITADARFCRPKFLARFLFGLAWLR